jgi:hypothetical protein
MTEKTRGLCVPIPSTSGASSAALLLLKRAESCALPVKVAAQLVGAAVAVELEIMSPIRLQNLSELNMDTDFVRSRAGRNVTVYLFIRGKRTKNGEDIELELPRDTMALLDLYMAKYRNHLIEPQYRGTGLRYLFPRPDGTLKTPRVFAVSICPIMRRELGIKFNMHLFRHLGCLTCVAIPGSSTSCAAFSATRMARPQCGSRFIEKSDAFRLFDSCAADPRALRPSRRALSKKGQP